MSITHNSAQFSTNGGSASTSVGFSLPSQPTEGNLMIAGFSYRLTGNTVTANPSGWQKLGSTRSNGDTNAEMWWKIAGAGESQTPSWTINTSAKSSGYLTTFTSTNGWPTTPTGVNIGAAGNGTGSQSSGTTGTSAAASGAHILAFVIYANDDSAVTWSSLTGTNVTLSQVHQAGSTGGPTGTRTQSQYAIGTRTTGNSTFAASGTISGTEDWAIVLGTFYENAPASSTPKSWAFVGTMAGAVPSNTSPAAITFVD